MARLPMRAYWMLAIIVSLALHAGALGAGLHLLGGPQTKRDVTEIRFEAAAPATTLRAAGPSETTRLAAEGAAETALRAAPAETLRPTTAEPAQPVTAVEQAPTVVPTDSGTADRPEVEKAAPVPSERATAGDAPERMVATSTAERATSTVPTPMVENRTAAERLATSPAVSPSAPIEIRESLAAIEPEAVPAQPAPAEQLAALPPSGAETAAAAPAERLRAAPTSRDSIAALPRAEAETAPVVGPLQGSTPQTATTERLPPAPQDREAVSALPRPQPETAPVLAPAPEAVQESLPQAVPAERLGPVAAAEPTERIASAPAGTAVERAEPVETRPSAPPGAGGAAPATLAPLPSAGETAAPVSGEAKEVVTASLFAPSLPGASLSVDTDKPTDLYRRAIDFVGQFEGGDCFVALPSVDRGGKIEFKAFGKDEGREKAFAAAYRSAIGLDAAINLGDINGAQCAALGFARSAHRYPDFGLILDLAAAEVTNGQEVAGSILSVKGRDLHALLVDDEGRIQSIDGQLVSRGKDGDRRFSFPVTLTNGPVATKQLLIAIASDRSLPSLDGATDTSDVEGFFRGLQREVAEADAAIDIAIAGFSVLPDPAASP